MPPIDFNGLDTVVHGPVRLGVLTALQIDGPLDFTTLKKRLNVADGAIGIHLRKLEDIGYLTCKKAFVGRRPKSTYRITPKGRGALRDYLDAMQRVINAVDRGEETH
ncbi:MAG: transcriptional regulator [Candidatus Nealsonbacteria bacterium]|nr:transcriptional regulator [Candidatus Nealsonbacteria bacterium]